MGGDELDGDGEASGTGAGVSPIKLYDCRHTAATTMIANEIPIPDVLYILGHSSPEITMRVYARWLTSHRRRAAETMAVVFPSTVDSE